VDGVNFGGLSPSWPMVGLLAGLFIYWVRLGYDVTQLYKLAKEHRDDLREHRADVERGFDGSHKEMATWINNHHESKVKPLELDILRLEKEQSKLHIAISDEYKALRGQNSEMVKELGEVKVFMATMNERWKHLTKENR
jgi:hypothetical protein